MRFQIDLLHGQGLPKRSRPGVITLAAVPFLVPLLASGLLVTHGLHTAALLKTEQMIHQQNLQHIAQHSEDFQYYESVQHGILNARHSIKNIADSLRLEMPLSPMLLDLVEALPPEVFFTELEFSYQPLQSKTTDPKTNQVKYVQTVQRTLRMTLAAPNHLESDQAVNSYIQKLRSAAFLSSAVQEIRIQSRQETNLDSRNLILYEIHCPLIEQR